MSLARVQRLLVVSPVGPLRVEHDGAAVLAIRYLLGGEHPPAGTRDEPARGDALGQAVVAQLGEYFAGTRREFDLPLALTGTAFRRRVWEALRGIAFGETRTYRELASRLGMPNGSRAVGQANRNNPLPIIVPCHRVVAAGGLGGYAGSGPDGEGAAIKRWLLRHEGVPA